MTDLELNGPLDLIGTLDLAGDGGKVKVNGKEALIEGAEGTATSPVLLPQPSSPADQGVKTKVVSSLGKTIKAVQPLVTSGMVLQGNNASTWPGMVLPSVKNTPPSLVTANGLPVNVVQDKAVIFPNGGSATLTTSGQ